MIPKSLHFIWLAASPDDQPSAFEQACRAQTIAVHDGWEVRDWTDAEILNEPDFDPIRPYLLDAWRRFDLNPTSRSDLMRLAVLYVHGGVYCDHDVWAIRRFDDLLDRDILLAADRMDPLLIGEHVMGAEPGNLKIWQVLCRFITSPANPKTGKYTPGLTRHVIESGCGDPESRWTCMLPKVFCPHGRFASGDELYQVYNSTHAVHCWAPGPYDVERLREISPQMVNP